jgi:hypothetical protein
MISRTTLPNSTPPGEGMASRGEARRSGRRLGSAPDVFLVIFRRPPQNRAGSGFTALCKGERSVGEAEVIDFPAGLVEDLQNLLFDESTPARRSLVGQRRGVPLWQVIVAPDVINNVSIRPDPLSEESLAPPR